ncbi:MAG: efflux RND transporter periplasmic adaptor subunit [Myxococcota bacterium]
MARDTRWCRSTQARVEGGRRGRGDRRGGAIGLGGRAARGALLPVLVLVLVGCGDASRPSGPPPSLASGEAIPVVEARGPAFEWASGSVASARHTVVASRVLATIEDVRVRAGAEVARGDLLVVLDARDLAARVEEAGQAHAAAKAQRTLAEREDERQMRLLAEGVGTVQERDRAAAALRVARAEVARTEQAIEAARIARSHAEIRSPVSGRVVDRLAEPGDTATPGKPLLRLYDPSVLRVEAPVRESLAVKLHLGQALPVEVESLDLRVEGEVDEIVPFAEAGARTLLVKVRLPADERLYAGLFARVAIPAGERTRVLIPASAVVREGQLEQVWMAEGSGAAELRAITTGERQADGRIEVLSGLRAGERIRVPEAGAGAGAAEGSGDGDAAAQEATSGAAIGGRTGGGDAAEARWREQGAAAIAALKRGLMGELSRAIAAGGAVEAIEVCRVRAPQIARAVETPAVRVGRTSHRLRNAANAAPVWVAPLLDDWVAGRRTNEPAVVALGDGRGGYVEPLFTGEMCLACHGESIAPDVAARIRALYPEDRAVGFRVGALRGLAWAEIGAAASP